MLLKQTASQPDLRRWAVLASPIAVVVIGNLAANFFTATLGQWAWVGSCLTYWVTLGLIVGTFRDRSKPQPWGRWFSPSQGSRWSVTVWFVVAVALGLLSFPLLMLPNLRVMQSIPLIILWFLFAVVNAPAEEIYWRGFLLDELSYLPRWAGVAYTSALFVAIHPLMLGVFSRIQSFDPANPLKLLPFLLILVMLSLVFCLMYLNTKSLRLPILMHFLSDLGNLSIFLFMNMITI